MGLAQKSVFGRLRRTVQQANSRRVLLVLAIQSLNYWNKVTVFLRRRIR
jgi:hypothetical protein